MRKSYMLVCMLILTLFSPAVFAQGTTDAATSQYRIGIEQMRQGRWQKAITSLEKSVSLDPNQAASQEALGGAYFNYAVELSLANVISSDQGFPTDEETKTRIAKLEAAAEDALKKAVELQPNLAGLHHTLGWFYLAHHWLHLFDTAQVGEAITSPTESSTQETASSETSESSTATPSTEKAAASTETTEKSSSVVSTPQPNVSQTAATKVDYPTQSIQEFENAIKLAPQVPEYHRSLADALRAIGASGGTANLSQITAPSGTSSESSESTTPSAIGYAERASQEYMTALQVNPRNADMQYMIYNEMIEGSRGPSDEALTHLNQAYRLDRSNALYGYEMAYHQFQLGYPVDAFNTLRSANRASRFDSYYIPAYPTRLDTGLRRLGIGIRSYSVTTRLQELARSAIFTASEVSYRDGYASIRMYNEVVGLGERLAFQDDPMIQAAGADIAETGLQDIEDIAVRLGDSYIANRSHDDRIEFRGMLDSIRYRMGPTEVPTSPSMQGF